MSAFLEVAISLRSIFTQKLYHQDEQFFFSNAKNTYFFLFAKQIKYLIIYLVIFEVKIFSDENITKFGDYFTYNLKKFIYLDEISFFLVVF